MHPIRMYLLLLKGVGFNLQIIWMMLIIVIANRRDELPGFGGGAVTWVNFCWVCAAGLSESLPLYSLFFWPIIDPMLVMINYGQM